MASGSGLRWPPVCRKSPAPPQRQLPHPGWKEGGRFGKGSLKGTRATHLQKPLSQMWGGGGREGPAEARIWSSVPCLRKRPAARWPQGPGEVRVTAGQAPGKLCSWLPRNLTGYNRCQPHMPVPGGHCIFQTSAWPMCCSTMWLRAGSSGWEADAYSSLPSGIWRQSPVRQR